MATLKNVMMALKDIKWLSVLVLSACVTTPYPYHDSSINDHNRAPASLGIPQDAQAESDSLKNVEKQTEADFLFLKSELITADGGEDVVELLKAALSIDSNSVTLMQRLAVAYYKRGQVTDAIYWIQKALEKDPKKKDNLLLYGSMLMAKKEFDKAETAYLKITKITPDEPDAYLYLGALYSEKNDYVKANNYFTKVIALGTYEPKHLPYYYRARVVYDSNNKKLYAQAKKDLKSCFDIKPDFLEAIQVYSNIVEKTEGRSAMYRFYVDYQKKYGPIVRLAEVLSQYYIEKDEYDKAYEQLEILENNSEEPIQVKLKMALILIDRKDYVNAVVKLQELNAVVPESDKVKFYLSAVYEELKQPKKAIESYLAIVPTSSHYDDARVRAMFLLKAQNKPTEAMQVLKEALVYKKDNLQMHMMLAQLHEDQNQYDAAMVVLKNADKQFAKNAQIQYFMGTLYDRMNKKDDMLKSMRLAVSYDENNHQAMNYIAYSLSESGENLDEAEELALRAHSLQKEDGFIVDTLGWVYFKKGEYAKALEYLEKAHNMLPDVGIIAEHLGDVYLKLKREDKARNAYLKARKEEKDTERIKAIDGKLTAIEKEFNQRAPASLDSAYP